MGFIVAIIGFILAAIYEPYKDEKDYKNHIKDLERKGLLDDHNKAFGNGKV